jgi:hypothetical protein
LLLDVLLMKYSGEHVLPAIITGSGVGEALDPCSGHALSSSRVCLAGSKRGESTSNIEYYTRLGFVETGELPFPAPEKILKPLHLVQMSKEL